jgi:dTDP-4-amino-4,6-dideoxygalactose transaminase
VQKYTESRKKLYNVFKSKLDLSKFYLPSELEDGEHVPFCLPIICKGNKKKKALSICEDLDIEYRPIISGFLGYQTCYKEFFQDGIDYVNSINLHHNGFYVGLFHNLRETKIEKLVSKLNNI